MSKSPLIIAHRGSSLQAPENTLPAFEKAIQDKADGIELDIWVCASGEIVVTHDQDPFRQSGVQGDIEKMSFNDLKKLDFGHLKSNDYRGTRIPRLEEVLDLAKDLSCINIEIKGERFKSSGVEHYLIKLIKNHYYHDNILISSFNPLILHRLKKIAPWLRRGLLFYEGSARPLRRAWSAPLLKLYSIHPSCEMLSAALSTKAKKNHQKIFAWTINDESQLDKCLLHQVDAVITDAPLKMREYLNSKDKAYVAQLG